MKKVVLLGGLLALAAGCSSAGSNLEQTLSSPDKKISIEFGINKKNRAWYLIKRNGNVIVDSSALGLHRKDGDFASQLKILEVSELKKIEDQYTMSTGKQKDITYTANQKTFRLQNKQGKELDIIFNVSNDGVAFKYKFPETSGDIKLITDEITTYNFSSAARAWLQPMSKAKTGWEQSNPSYEEYYVMNVPISEKASIGQGWVYPALIKDADTWVSISESGLGEKYCATHLNYSDKDKALKVVFPQKEEVFSKEAALNPQSTLPWETPWRILAIGDLSAITASTLGTDLADKAISKDIDFVRPGVATWSWGLLKDDSVNYETTKEFIDYAHQMQWPYCLIDVNWDVRIGEDKIKELVAYAKERNVKLMLWYNSSGDWNTVKFTPKSRLLTAEGREKEFKWLEEIGIAGVKIDFFGGDGQSMIAYYHEILKTALKHKILINFHGATLPRGWQRTYPNYMTAEAIKGFEFITFDQSVADAAPSHCAMLPFTRNLYDPMDFTPMSLDTIPNIHRRSTAAFELALPTLFLSGVQNIAEIPSGMAKQPEFVKEYLRNLPTAWDESKLLAGFPGKDVVIARRKGKNWYVTGINGENKAKEIVIDLSFLSSSEGYMITDGKTSKFQKSNVKGEKITISFVPYGGFVMKF